MINKKLFVLSFLMSFVVLVGYLYAADGSKSKNFVTLLSGETHTVVSDNSGKPGKSEYSFIGQSVHSLKVSGPGKLEFMLPGILTQNTLMNMLIVGTIS